MTPNSARRPVFRPVTPQRQQRVTQCPGMSIHRPPDKKKCLPMRLLPRLVMCACTRHLRALIVQCGVIRLCRHRRNSVPQCPGIILQTDQRVRQRQLLPLPRGREIECNEEREERARINEAFNHDAQWAAQSAGAPSSTTIPDRLTTLGLPHSDPISAMRPPVYPPVTQQGRPIANHNSSLQIGQELGESVGLRSGLYKAPVPDPQHHTWNSSSRAYSSEEEPPSPTRTSVACSSGALPRTGIVYPLQPRQRRPDTRIDVEAAALPEPAALQREELLPSREVPTDLIRPAQRPGRKR